MLNGFFFAYSLIMQCNKQVPTPQQKPLPHTAYTQKVSSLSICIISISKKIMFHWEELFLGEWAHVNHNLSCYVWYLMKIEGKIIKKFYDLEHVRRSKHQMGFQCFFYDILWMILVFMEIEIQILLNKLKSS